MECKVNYIKWEMDCCGTPFSIGDTVEWTVSKCKSNESSGLAETGEHEYYYNAHCSDFDRMLVLTGRVKDIKVEFIGYKPIEICSSPRKQYFMQPVSSKIIASKHAPCEMSDIENITDLDDMEENEFIVVLEDYSIKPFLEVYKLPWISENKTD